MGRGRERMVNIMEIKSSLPLILCFTHSFVGLIIFLSVYPSDHQIIKILSSFLI